MTCPGLGLGDRKIHLRGLHYMVIGRTKPDGTPYTNTDADWLWLSGRMRQGRPLARLHPVRPDHRPAQRRADSCGSSQPERPWPYLNVGVDVEIPDADDIEPAGRR